MDGLECFGRCSDRCKYPGNTDLSRIASGRQSADAEAFGAAILLLDRVNPDRVAINLNPDTTAESAKWAELQEQLAVARERLLVVSAGHPRRHVRELALATEVKSLTHSRPRIGS